MPKLYHFFVTRIISFFFVDRIISSFWPEIYPLFPPRRQNYIQFFSEFNFQVILYKWKVFQFFGTIFLVKYFVHVNVGILWAKRFVDIRSPAIHLIFENECKRKSVNGNAILLYFVDRFVDTIHLHFENVLKCKNKT